MTHTLVTFLGRPQLQDGRYREAKYEFPDDVQRTSAFFGLALAEYLEPDDIVILGTHGSMWGVLVSSLDERSGDGFRKQPGRHHQSAGRREGRTGYRLST